MLKRWMIVTAVAISSSLYADTDKPATLEGTLVSASCYLPDHSKTGNEMGGMKECGTGCLKQGKPGGLLTKDNAFFILDAPSLPLAPYVGQQIQVTGVERGKDIFSVKTVAVRKAGGWESIDIKRHTQQ